MARCCFRVEGINPADIAARNEVPVNIHGDLDRAVAHLLLDIGKAGALLNEKGSERVSKCMEGDPTNPCCF